MLRFRVLGTQDLNGVRVLGTIFSGGGYYILDINLPIFTKTTHYVLALTSLVILNLLAPARTVTSLRILQVVVTRLSIRYLGTPRLLRLLTGSLAGPGRAQSLSPSLAIIGALCKNIVFMFRSQCPVNGSHPLPIGPDTAQPVHNSSPSSRPAWSVLVSRGQPALPPPLMWGMIPPLQVRIQSALAGAPLLSSPLLPHTGPPGPGSHPPDLGEGRWQLLLVSQCVQLPEEPATGKLVPANSRSKPNSESMAAPGPGCTSRHQLSELSNMELTSEWDSFPTFYSTQCILKSLVIQS